MEFLLLLILGGAFGIAVGSQLSRQPPQITIVQVQPDEMRGASGGCGGMILGIFIFLVLAWLMNTLPTS